MEKGYAVITRTWKAGDKIDLVLPMKVQRVKSIDEVAANRGHVALQYGPLIYSAERADQDLEDVLSPKSALGTEWRGDFLGGVLVIKGSSADGSPLTAIPNYARDNRPFTPPENRSTIRSTVWLKDQ